MRKIQSSFVWFCCFDAKIVYIFAKLRVSKQTSEIGGKFEFLFWKQLSDWDFARLARKLLCIFTKTETYKKGGKFEFLHFGAKNESWKNNFKKSKIQNSIIFHIARIKAFMYCTWQYVRDKQKNRIIISRKQLTSSTRFTTDLHLILIHLDSWKRAMPILYLYLDFSLQNKKRIAIHNEPRMETKTPSNQDVITWKNEFLNFLNFVLY